MVCTVGTTHRALVAAGIKDLSRPAEVISIPQNLGKKSALLLPSQSQKAQLTYRAATLQP